ncbi:cupin domain-containing protein [Mycolicibacterium sp. A43C]
MEIINLPRSFLDGDSFGSRGIAMCSISGFDADVSCRVHIVWCEPDSVLGCHRAGRHQLFAVISGTGWVAGADGVRVSISTGQAALWSPGEVHESGSETGMGVLIVASGRPLP